MQTRSRFLPNPKSLYQRLNDEAQRLRKEARVLSSALSESG